MTVTVDEREDRRPEFEEVALPLQSTMLRMALAMTHNPADAADLVQETFYKAWRFFPAFRKGSDCKAWLTAILRNAYINRYRRKQRRPTEIEYDEWQDIDSTFLSERAGMPRPDESPALEVNLGDEVLDALDQLTDHFREVVVLADVKGMSYQEVADRVGCPIGTVRSRLFRARAMLRRTLGDYAQQEGIFNGSSDVEEELEPMEHELAA
jgi:RNA polymerase sigma-70 factor, ECF subfamily